jgi:hypothetical protein
MSIGSHAPEKGKGRQIMEIWVNFWRYKHSLPPYDVTIHSSEHGAIESIAEKFKEDRGGYLYTLKLDPETLNPPTVLDLREAAHEMVEEWRIERRTYRFD